MGGPKFRAFFSFLPPQFFFLLSLSWGLFVEFCWCLKRRGPEMCTFGVLGLSCASPGGPVWWGRRGFTRQPESPHVHISGPWPSKTPTNSTKGPQERGRRKKIVAGGGKKRAKFWAVRRRVVRRRAVRRRAVRRRVVRRRVVQVRGYNNTQQHTTQQEQHHINTTPTPHRFTTAHKIDDDMDRSHGFATHTRRQQKVHVRLRPISTSANFDFGQFRLRPISTSANFDFGQLAEVELSEVELAEVEHPRWIASPQEQRGPSRRSMRSCGITVTSCEW